MTFLDAPKAPSKKRRVQLALVAAVAGLAAPFIMAAPAYAVPTCSNAGSLNNVATASCSGTGQARLVVTCNSVINPFVQNGPWVSINGGKNIVFSHSTCIGRNPVVFVGTR